MPRSTRRSSRILLVIAVALGVTIQGTAPAAAEPVVGLGLAQSYAVLAGTPSVDNTGLTVVTGDLGIAPAAAVNGFGGPPSGTVTGGAIHAADLAAGDAKAALTTAYLDAAGRADTQPALGVALDTLVLGTGVYSGGSLELGAGGTLVLDGGNDPDAVFIFRSASTLVTFAGSTIQLIGQAQACNVFWQVTSSATLGTNSTFVGTVMALTDIQAQTGATIQGRLLARNGQVTLDTNTITRSDCVIPATTTIAPLLVVPDFSTTSTTSPSTTTTSTSTTSTTAATPTTRGPVATVVPATTTTAVPGNGTVTGSGGPGAPRGPGAPTPFAAPPADSSVRGDLPRTGADGTRRLVLVGLGALVVGGALLVPARPAKRRS